MLKYVYHEPKPSYFHTSLFDLFIKTSNIPNAGSGVFTLDYIPPNTFIDYYTGSKVSIPLSSYYFSINEYIGIDAFDYPRCYMAMINDIHGTKYEVNCESIIKNEIISIWSIKSINKGEELFMSYGPEYWNW